MAFGVELPENIGSTPSEPTGGTEISTGAPAGEKFSSEAPKTETTETKGQPTVADLDKLERFRFAGREWSPKELKNAYLMQSDYTRKMQEVAETRKYTDNFASDLQTVLKDRHRLEEMRRIYPKEYMDVAERILQEKGGQPAPTQPTQTDSVKSHPEFQQLRSELDQWKAEKEQAQVASNQSWLDTQFDKLAKKYPFADPEVITARAEIAITRHGQKLAADGNGEQLLDRLFKKNDEEIKAKWAEHYKGKVNQQIDVGKRGKDVGAGGGVPGSAPKGFKTIKEATNAFLSDIAANR